MFELPRPTRNLVGAALIGAALAAAPAIGALNATPLQPVAQTGCVGSESVVDGEPTCVPAPAAPAPPDAPDVQSPSVDNQQHDGGHH